MLNEMAEFIRSHNNECGIVYCVLPQNVAKNQSELLKRNISAVKYHGQLSEEVKTSSLNKWMSGEASVMVANSSFGIGIDKANVRFVLHARLTTSIEEYFQQCGRAGRDGAPAICCLFSQPLTKTRCTNYFTPKTGNFPTGSAYLNDLKLMLQDPVQCRHKALMTSERKSTTLCVSKIVTTVKKEDHFNPLMAPMTV